ncbi:MAG: flagellar hook-associated protein FlgK [Treponemataceae bacterium]|nr:MAG: flagellar hook-associated protein FlgK [Treponemataceae bacterium]
MGSTFAGIELGKRSLMTHTQQINTAGHNISNVDTEGYSRQRVQVKAFDPLYRPDLTREMLPGQVGQGSEIGSINRLRDEFLDARIVGQANLESYWGTRDKYYGMIEQIYQEPNDVSVRSTMDMFWQGWQELALNPEEKSARQVVVNRAETLTNSIKQEFNSLAAISNQLTSDIDATVKQVNSYTAQIAELNGEIVRSRAMDDNPNDLLDRRDLLVDKLSELINITTDTRDADEFMIHTDGRILVQGSISRNFEVIPLTEAQGGLPGMSRVVWEDTQNEATFTGGSLGALIELRDVDIRSHIQNLNTMTLNFADLINGTHRAGMGANGTTGLDFFVEEPFVTDVAGNFDRNGDGADDSSYIFRMTGTNELALTQKTGLQGEITIAGKTDNITVPYYPTDTVETIINRINDSDGEVKAYLDRNNRLALKGTVAVAEDNPDFVIRHVEDTGFFLTGYSGLLQAQGAAGAYDFNQANAVNALVQADENGQNGVQFAVAPVINPSAYLTVNSAIRSDVLSVAAALPDNNGVAERGDNRAAVEIAAIRNSTVMVGRTRTFDEYFAETVTQVGLQGEKAQINHLSQTTIMNDLKNWRQTISGVNMDEELADMIKFQHGYNASAKYLSVVDKILDTIINGII